MTYRLYGTPGSLYTAKARSWLIKNGVPFENRAAGEPRFREGSRASARRSFRRSVAGSSPCWRRRTAN